jgi:basic membrane protein A and related proteins
MFDSTKRASMRWAGLAALAATAGLVGCGKKEEASKAAAPAAAPAATKAARRSRPSSATR